MILFIVIEFAATSVERYFGNRGYNVGIFFVAKFLPFFKNKTAMEIKNNLLYENLRSVCQETWLLPGPFYLPIFNWNSAIFLYDYVEFKGTLTQDILVFLSSSILNQYFFSVR
jgi:hypothetical protein